MHGRKRSPPADLQLTDAAPPPQEADTAVQLQAVGAKLLALQNALTKAIDEGAQAMCVGAATPRPAPPRTYE